MAAGSLTSYLMTQNGWVAEEKRSCITLATRNRPQTFRMAFQSKGGLWSFQVEVCLGREATRTAMRVHFLHRHVLETVVILEEGNLPHP